MEEDQREPRRHEVRLESQGDPSEDADDDPLRTRRPRPAQRRPPALRGDEQDVRREQRQHEMLPLPEVTAGERKQRKTEQQEQVAPVSRPIVSINEAIELAKAYGGTDSGRFVNGILDRVRKDLDRPAREPVIKRDS